MFLAVVVMFYCRKFLVENATLLATTYNAFWQFAIVSQKLPFLNNIGKLHMQSLEHAKISVIMTILASFNVILFMKLKICIELHFAESVETVEVLHSIAVHI